MKTARTLGRSSLRGTLLALGCAAVLAGIGTWRLTEPAGANDDIHYNNYYWPEWAYTPLTAVNAYDCISQDNALQGAANEWNATGYVLVATQLGNCNMSAVGIRWLEGVASCNSSANMWAYEQKVNYLDPDNWTPPTYRALQVNINIGVACPNGDGTCGAAAPGGSLWYSPCDVLTHEMGHALGLQDHYRDTGIGTGPSYYVFSYPNPPVTVNNPPTQVPNSNISTIMDYPHITTIQQHDKDDLATLYRRAPFSPSGLAASYENFHRINMGWIDRSHNEAYFSVKESINGGSFSSVGSVGADPPLPLFGRDWYIPERQYCYRVSATNSWALQGADSGQSCVTLPASVGSISGSFPQSQTAVALCWNAAPSSAQVDYYKVVRRRKSTSGSITTSTYIANPNASCFGQVLWNHTVSSTSYQYHFAVAGCDETGCSYYRDMTSPNKQWVTLPYNGVTSGSATSGYHTH